MERMWTDPLELTSFPFLHTSTRQWCFCGPHPGLFHIPTELCTPQLWKLCIHVKENSTETWKFSLNKQKINKSKSTNEQSDQKCSRQRKERDITITISESTCMRMCTRTHIHTQNACMHKCTHTHMHTYMYGRTHTHTYMHTTVQAWLKKRRRKEVTFAVPFGFLPTEHTWSSLSWGSDSSVCCLQRPE